MALLQPHRIPTTDLATLQNRGVDPNVGFIVLGRCAQNPIVLGKITLRKRCHYAARTRASDGEAHSISDRKLFPDPGILHEFLLAIRSLHHDVWPKSSHLESALRIQVPQPIERRGG
jgi:hypothetical protein